MCASSQRPRAGERAAGAGGGVWVLRARHGDAELDGGLRARRVPRAVVVAVAPYPVGRSMGDESRPASGGSWAPIVPDDDMELPGSQVPVVVITPDPPTGGGGIDGGQVGERDLTQPCENDDCSDDCAWMEAQRNALDHYHDLVVLSSRHGEGGSRSVRAWEARPRLRVCLPVKADRRWLVRHVRPVVLQGTVE